MSFTTGLAVVGTFVSTDEADTAKGVLHGVGVDAIVRADNADLTRSELLVRAADAVKARDALANARSKS